MAGEDSKNGNYATLAKKLQGSQIKLILGCHSKIKYAHPQFSHPRLVTLYIKDAHPKNYENPMLFTGCTTAVMF
jgi:hypothetical protein